jgi:hypothetical protein
MKVAGQLQVWVPGNSQRPTRFCRLIQGRGLVWWEKQGSITVLGEAFLCSDLKAELEGSEGQINIVLTEAPKSVVLSLRSADPSECTKWLTTIQYLIAGKRLHPDAHKSKEALPSHGSTEAANHPRWREMQPTDWKHDAEALRQGSDWEELELNTDVYATAYLLATHSTEEGYSFLPHNNPSMYFIWGYFLFLVCSQSFVIYALVFLYPPEVDSEIVFVDCAAPDSDAFTKLLQSGYFSDRASCEAMGDPVLSVEVAAGQMLQYRRVDVELLFYHNTCKGSMVQVRAVYVLVEEGCAFVVVALPPLT